MGGGRGRRRREEVGNKLGVYEDRARAASGARRVAAAGTDLPQSGVRLNDG